MQKELLRMENIVKTFPGVKALNNAAITVHAGEVMGFMGENGAGKSTLMFWAVFFRLIQETFILKEKK